MASPAPDRDACGAEAAGHVGCSEALRQAEDHLGSEAQVLGRLMGTDQREELLALLFESGTAGGLGPGISDSFSRI